MTGTTPMRIGINTMSFMWRASAKQALETLAREGYRHFEVMAQPPHFDPMMEPTEARAFARFLHDAQLTVESINLPSLDQNLGSASRPMREYSIGLYQCLIDIAAIIGAQAIIVVTGRVNPLIAPPRADLESWFGDAFAHVLRAAERAGIQLLLENIPIGVFPTAAQMIAFADDVNSPNVGICYDIANAHFIGEDVAAGVHAVKSRLGIVHLSDTNRDRWRHDPVGQGSCDFAGFARALREIGYDKTSMLEIVAEQAIEQTLESHRRVAQWGWETPPV
ncbi:MAG: sugar phosphate isomerase/epimerase [Burkholderiales bacterium]|nr:sugar phosphate isomerase/epimerase [Burkholderiales bacterium]